MKLGRTGEAIAKEYFESLGFEIVAENYRFERAETDLMMFVCTHTNSVT